MNSIEIKAYAKINLALDVLGILENGYHKLDMIMHMTDLHDDVKVSWEPDNSGKLNINISMGDSSLPVNEDNIAYRAVLAMSEGREISGTVNITIKKRIPVAAGLAGGSSNSAAVILALNELWELDLGLEELMETGKKTGSDVPFSIAGAAKLNGMSDKGFTCARAEYDGTVLTPVSLLKGVYAVLSKPPIGVSTAEVYRGIDKQIISRHPDVETLINAIEERNFVYIEQNMINVLENYTVKMYNEISETMDEFRKSDLNVCPVMSGSGPTVFCITEDEKKAEELFRHMKRFNTETHFCCLV